MQILIAYPIAEDVLLIVLNDNILYRPDLQAKGSRFLSKALIELRPDVLIIQELPNEQAIRSWKSAMPDATMFIVQNDNNQSDGKEQQFWFADVPVFRTGLNSQIHTDFLPLHLAERVHTEQLWRVHRGNQSNKNVVSARQTGSVALVGAGIVNLISAYYLTIAGYSIAIYDAAPDPRDSEHWSKYGCTRGGGDARMFSLTEADNYNDKDFTGVNSFNNLFGSKVSACGWLLCDQNQISIPEQTWIHEYEIVPPWLANVYNDDILSFNHESKVLWEKSIEQNPQLFKGVELREGIVRLYSDEAQYQHSIKRHIRECSLKRTLTTQEVISTYPVLTDACKNGLVVGALEVVGFTLNVHKFMKNLVDYLEQVGVKFCWNNRVTKILRNDDNVVIGLGSDSETIAADHYAISPGVYGDELLEGTKVKHKIQGVLGGWMEIPNLAPKLEHSLKIARKGHITADANVTVATNSAGEEILIVGSGYGYTGLNPNNILPDQLEAMYCGIEDSIKQYFPLAYETAKQSGLLKTSRRYCHRPFTSTSLGMFEIIESANNGKLIITGGHNTGGFAQSPAIASAVLAALQGQFHPMHQLYNPNRFTSFRSKVSS